MKKKMSGEKRIALMVAPGLVGFVVSFMATSVTHGSSIGMVIGLVAAGAVGLLIWST